MPFFSFVAQKIDLKSDTELRLWKLIYHGLSIWNSVSAGELSMIGVGAYGRYSEFKSTLQKLSSAGIVKVSKDEYGVLRFERGPN